MSWNDSFNLVLRLAEPDVLRLSKRKQEIFLNDISEFRTSKSANHTLGFFVYYVFLPDPSKNIHFWPSIAYPWGFWWQGRAATVASQNKSATLLLCKHSGDKLFI